MYGTALFKLLEDYSAEAGRVKFAISHHMEGQHIVEDKLLGQNYSVLMYPENHMNLHLGDVQFFNMATQLRKLKFARHTDAYFEVNLGLSLFPKNVLGPFFT